MRIVGEASGLLIGALLAVGVARTAFADEWSHWRGPHQNGTTSETDLISDWSKDGTHVLWRHDFIGRSTMIVFDGRACAIGRAGEGIRRQEVVACWDAGSGEKVWERRFNVLLTTVPWNRVGWASMAGDSETGNLYAQGVDGRFVALARDGSTVWEWSLGQDLGRWSGYGGRTNTPVVEDDLVIVHVIGTGWGPNLGPFSDRYFAFDKRSGEIRWVTPKSGDRPKDANTYSAPVVATIGGQRLVVAGGADGWIHAFQARTGEPVWQFLLSQRGLNSSVVVDGDVVFAAHSEENVDEPTMGRVVAIDATGHGDVTKTHEVWRAPVTVGYASPMAHGDRLFVADNSANLVALDKKTGEVKWTHNFGTVGKSSPVWADGKIYLTEVNGNVRIVQPGAEGAEVLDDEHLEMPGSSRYAEIYASPAVAYGRIYFATEEGVYCLGDKTKPFEAAAAPAKTAEKTEEPGKAALLRIFPAVVVGKTTETHQFRAVAFDALGREIGPVDAEWGVAGIPGAIDATGKLVPDAAKISGTRAGMVTAKVAGPAGELSARAELRLGSEPPWSEDFEGLELGKIPSGWTGIGPKGRVVDDHGNKVLEITKVAGGAPRAHPNLAPSFLAGYTIQADVKGIQEGRLRSDVGVINSGYIFDMMGNHQRLQIRSWSSEYRMMQQRDFAWDPDVWYTMKLRVDYAGRDDSEHRGTEKAIVRGKVWKQGGDEPAEWTFEVEDPLPIRNGSPGLYAFSPVPAYFDNVQVEVSK